MNNILKLARQSTLAATRAFWEGFKVGVKETPRGFFAPVVAIWRILVNVTDSLVKHKSGTKHA